MTAITAPVVIVLAAVAVDTGSLYGEQRKAQSLADLAAITAAANLAKAEDAALMTMVDNGVTDIVIAAGGAIADETTAEPGATDTDNRIVVTTGRYQDDPALSPEKRFVPGGKPVNAARVTYRTIGTRHFAGALIPPPEIIVSGLATTSAEAAFSVGSRLAALDGGIVNALLGGLTGSNVSLSVMDYDALLSADVSLLSFLDALAVELDLTAGSYTEVLDTDITVGQIARALSKADELDGIAKAAAGKLATQAGGAHAPELRLSRLISIGEVADLTIEQVAADVNVMELLSLSAIVAGAGRQVALDLGANVPGLLAITVDLAIGEPPQQSPWFRIGSGGEMVRTAQTRLAVTAEIGNAGGLSGLLGSRIRIPLYLELAYAEARLKSVSCPAGRPDGVKVAVEARPGVANLYLAEVDRARIADFNNPAPRSPARLIQVPLATVTGQANAEMSNIGWKTVTFDASDIASGRIRQVSTRDFVTSLTASLFSSLSLDVDVKVGGLLNLPLISLPNGTTALLGQTIGSAAPMLDTVLNNVLATLGLSLGQADVRVHGAICGRAVLVQ